MTGCACQNRQPSEGTNTVGRFPQRANRGGVLLLGCENVVRDPVLLVPIHIGSIAGAKSPLVGDFDVG